MNDTSGAAARPASPAILKFALMGLAGTSIEWYDFFLYGIGAALVFPTVFFPASVPHSVAVLASYSIFAVGFLARPVGAIIFGHFGDKLGRKKALASALVLMGVATTLIACLPGYAAAGPIAPTLLVLLRFAQGLAIGGQWGGAMLLVIENAPAKRRGFYGSFAQAGAPTGVVLANLAFLAVAVFTPADAFLVWGWRLPFLLSLLLVGLGLYVHLKLEDTLAFRALNRDGTAPVRRARSPILEVMTAQPRLVFLAAGSFIATNFIFYVLIAWSIGYATSADGLNVPRELILTAVLIGSGVMSPTLLLFGAISDRYGRRRIYMAGAALSCLFAFAIFPLLATRTLLGMSIGIGGALGLTGMMYGPQAALFGELFATQVRYSGVSLSYQIGSIFGGGLAPLLATSLYAAYHSTFGIALCIAFVSLLSLVSVSLLRETSSVSLDAGMP